MAHKKSCPMSEYDGTLERPPKEMVCACTTEDLVEELPTDEIFLYLTAKLAFLYGRKNDPQIWECTILLARQHTSKESDLFISFVKGWKEKGLWTKEDNFPWTPGCFTLKGMLTDIDHDTHCFVYPTEEELNDAGTLQEASTE